MTSLLMLIKAFRWIKTSVFFSCHDICELNKKQRLIFTTLICFKGMSEDRLELLYNMNRSNVDFETFKEIYKTATQGSKYNFLCIDQYE